MIRNNLWSSPRRSGAMPGGVCAAGAWPGGRWRWSWATQRWRFTAWFTVFIGRRDLTPPYQAVSSERAYLLPSVCRRLVAAAGASAKSGPVSARAPAGGAALAAAPWARTTWAAMLLGSGSSRARASPSWWNYFLHRHSHRRAARQPGRVFRRAVDDFIVWIYSTFASIPGLLFILAIAMVRGRGLAGVYLASV